MADNSSPEERGIVQTPVQFGVRTLLIGSVVLSLMLATINWLGTVWSAIVIWSTLLIAAHVLGNFWGTRLRERTTAALNPPPAHEASGPAPLPFAPRTQLSANQRLGWTPTVVTAAGVVAGGSLGLMAFLAAQSGDEGAGALALATLSCGGIGGIFAFLAASFAKVFSRAWNQAARRSPPTESHLPQIVPAELPAETDNSIKPKHSA